ncbi:C4-dicarboxylate ABC transporter substrate-binding protein [Arthrobacter sp. MYb23]|uniref:TAXI family TRAP transporter solute-binding subunit n=1 Tax=unclassified Arthrobacter TaxID=235627 RepID=UPI000CFB6661|nr:MULTISPECIES: TAXI family TRAP transporter solute-binding subunit [unclassified Arthrobacter]PRB40543.1 C4-dicarboxylate ABC transporter substrate-binding protein [Arthrobacter sp. MYb51]PRB94058.1 C4-dicarboxylate ABC transporter substrate-binding protein [Arthrobacter sp. MYb23]
MPDSLAFSRRSVLKGAVAIGLGGSSLASTTACTPEEQPKELTVAGGESGGFYLEFATLLAALLQREGVAANAVALTTGGSLENIQRVVSDKATFAVALADAAAQAAAPAGNPAQPGDLVALGKVYQNYVHCIVREDSGIRTLADLAGKTAGVGEVGSGTTLTAGRIITAAGLSEPPRTVKQVNLGLNQALASLQDGSIEMMIQSGGVPTAPIAAAAKDIGLRLLDISELIPATRAQSGFFYDRVLIPANSYGNAPAVWTVGVANLLLCRRDLADHVVRQTVELLVDQAQDLVPTSSTGVQFLSPETLINTAGIPLHPAAEAAYRALHG